MSEEIVVTLREASEILNRPWQTLRVWAMRKADGLQPLFRENGRYYYSLEMLRRISTMRMVQRARRMGRRVPAGSQPSEETLARLDAVLVAASRGETGRRWRWRAR